jgi:hypothetical protein
MGWKVSGQRKAAGDWRKSGVHDGLFNLSRAPVLGGVDQSGENGARKRSLVVTAFGMPLDGDDKMGIGAG